MTSMPIGSMYRPLLEIAREARVDVDGTLARAGLSEATLLDRMTRLAPDRSRKLAAELIAQIGDPQVGLRAAERLRLNDMDLLGYLVRHSPHPLAAIEQLVRYARLLGDTADARIERAGARVAMTFGLLDGRRMLPEATDYTVASIFRLVRELSRGRALPAEVFLQRPRPARPAGYRRFFQCPVSFGTDRSKLVYEQARLTVPFADGDSRLVAILEVRADEVIATLPRRTTVVEHVRAHITSRLENGACDVRATALELGLSERTLRRRLRKSGSTYRTVLDEVRRELALALVEQRDESIATIAHRVGFADTTGFARAFRRWTGLQPHEYRVR
jgi:AraC-like DNA-binding protein